MPGTSSQAQSLLFRLPRELRDEIYTHYLFEADGYHHEFDERSGGKLRRSDGQPIDLRLMYTCKRAAAEMEGMALRVNNAIFTSVYVENDEHPLRSNAFRFQRLLDYAHITKWRVLLGSAECVTPEIVAQVLARFPEEGQDVVDDFETNRDHNYRQYPAAGIYCSWYHLYAQHFVQRREVLDYMLQLISKDSRYTGVAIQPVMRSGRWDYEPFSRHVLFIKEAVSKIVQWRPDPWYIPSSGELDRMEMFLVPGEVYRSWGGNDPALFRWCYSANAAAIKFMEHLSQAQRLQIRRIIVDEAEMAVSSPQCHARGLVPFFHENPHLHVERRVGTWRHIYPSHEAETSYGNWWLKSQFRGAKLLHSVVPWVVEAVGLKARGLATHSFSLIIENGADEHVWLLLKEAAAMQDAFLTFCKHQKLLRYPESQSELYLTYGWSIPWYLPDNFPQAMKCIVEDKSIVRVEWPLGDVWDVEGMIRERRAYGLAQWIEDWRKNIRGKKIMAPSGGIGPYCGGYPDAQDED